MAFAETNILVNEKQNMRICFRKLIQMIYVVEALCLKLLHFNKFYFIDHNHSTLTVNAVPKSSMSSNKLVPYANLVKFVYPYKW